MSGTIFNNAEVIEDIRVLDRSTWPDDLRDLRYGEQQIRRMCQRFSLPPEAVQSSIQGMRELVDGERESENLHSLVTAVNTFPCSTAECERDFSLMNNISTDLRSSLTVANISNLMFISANGPPLDQLDLKPYVKSWLRTHRSAVDTRSRQVTKTTTEKSAVWTCL